METVVLNVTPFVRTVIILDIVIGVKVALRRMEWEVALLVATIVWNVTSMEEDNAIDVQLDTQFMIWQERVSLVLLASTGIVL